MMKAAALMLMLSLTVASAAPSGPVTYPLRASVMDHLPRVTAHLQDDPLYHGPLAAEGPTIETVLRSVCPDFLAYAQAGYTVTFRRAAGDGVNVRLADLIGFGAVLALTDGDASPTGRMDAGDVPGASPPHASHRVLPRVARTAGEALCLGHHPA